MNKTMFAVALIFSATNTSYAANLNATEIKAIYVGHSYTFKTKKEATGTVRYFKNGKSRLSKTNFSVKKDSGTWRIKGNKFCYTWKKIRSGKEKCVSINQIGKNKFRDSSGTAITRK